ncbi:hypothetical protein Clacol_003036 [Clathrus columnatus]|uniref:Uncharacterized protein n=1 Tax=Clathrus columnatus TaxID=1419009 RepID=A0AAV5A5Q3_9AGAM|nr:hypothetical protein Clacol_003036 [Clathrus columnatus]
MGVITTTGVRKPSKLFPPLFNDTMRLFKRSSKSKGVSSPTTWRTNPCWEVVEHIDIAPIVTVPYLNDEFFEKDALLRIARQDTSRTYVFYINPKDNQRELTQQAVIFARRQLLADARRYGFNSFIREGWEVTLFRNNNRWRIEVCYTGRPAFMARKYQSNTPPFLEMLA